MVCPRPPGARGGGDGGPPALPRRGGGMMSGMPMALAGWLQGNALPVLCPACGEGNALPVLCPACGESNLHPTRVEVDRGGEVVEVDAAGVGFTWRRPPARGVVILVEFVCENACRSGLRFAFHKGTTYVQTERRGHVVPDAFPPTIWRN